MEAFNLFPTPVWAKQLPAEPAERINGAIISLLEELEPRTVGPGPEDRQTHNDLQKRPELQELMAQAKLATGEVLHTLQIAYNSFQITGCWVNVIGRGGSHRPHSHANNYLSSVYYVSVPGEGGRIMFHDPRIQTKIIRPQTIERNAYNSDTANIPIRTGAMIIFPAWLTHSVEMSRSESRRISVSFNAMFNDFAERVAPPVW
jgi:uncharacterized protein (TIGR02466 family)